MEKVYEEAFYEVDEILKLMPIDLSSKIPTQFRQIISENKSKNYKIEIKEPLNEQKLKPETIDILGLIYRDFLSSPEEKEKLQKEDAEELLRIEKEREEQYSIDNIFNKKKNRNNQDENNFTEMIVYQEKGFFKKIVKFFKGFFIRDKF